MSSFFPQVQKKCTTWLYRLRRTAYRWSRLWRGQLADDDYELVEGAAWFDLNGFAIRLHATDEGVVVDIFDSQALNHEPFVEPLASTYAFSHELAEARTATQ